MKVNFSYFCMARNGSAHAGFVAATDAFEWAGTNNVREVIYVVVNIDGHPVNRMGAIL